MSASERLRELDAATPLEKYEIDLFSVLPEIVAVVKAAERAVSASVVANDDLVPTCHNKLAPALAALEERLKP